MPAAKVGVVIVQFKERDPKTGAETRYEVNDTYSGPNFDRYLNGGRGHGRLIRELKTPPPPPPEPSFDSLPEEN